MKEKVLNYISNFEEKYDKKVAVKVLPEEVFYMAEEYHQDYALKNPELMEKELIESGRKK
jgi:peptide methionine sulfoxide reductase MsrA